MTAVWRPVASGGVREWAALLRAATEADRGEEHYSERDLVEELTGPQCDLPRGSRAVFDGDRLAALEMLHLRGDADPVHRMRYRGVVHPAYRGRGLGAALLAWAHSAALSLHEQRFPGRPLELHTGTISTNTSAAALFTAHGYRPVRYFHWMRRTLDGGLPPVRHVPGFTIVKYSPELDEQARRVKNDAFRDHWGSATMSAERWRTAFPGSSSFRPDLSFLAVDTAAGMPAGVLLAQYRASATQATGLRDLHIAVVGTLREARGRGVASAMLGTTLHAARDLGFDTASLGVDTQKTTGALSVYEKAGLTKKGTWVAYKRDVTPGT